MEIIPIANSRDGGLESLAMQGTESGKDYALVDRIAEDGHVGCYINIRTVDVAIHANEKGVEIRVRPFCRTDVDTIATMLVDFDDVPCREDK